MKKFLFLFLFMAGSILLPSACCSTAIQPDSCANVPTDDAVFSKALNEPLDYSSAENWVLFPEPETPRKTVDVFYVYPTVFSDPGQPLMPWDDPGLRQKTENIARQQTGIMADFCNVYAPYCRQLEFRRIREALYKGESQPAGMEPGIEDLRNAFRYYLEHENGGRPFILLGHSQGAMALYEMLKRDFADASYSRRMVAAYLIGTPLPKKDEEQYSHLHFARCEQDTGVIIGYNTEAPNAEDSFFTAPGNYGINPLNWRTDAQPADAELNLGAVLFRYEDGSVNEIPHFTGAVLNPETGALVVEPKFDGKFDAPELLGKGIYHMNDLYFFYRNLEDNARKRIDAFWK